MSGTRVHYLTAMMVCDLNGYYYSHYYMKEERLSIKTIIGEAYKECEDFEDTDIHKKNILNKVDRMVGMNMRFRTAFSHLLNVNAEKVAYIPMILAGAFDDACKEGLLDIVKIFVEDMADNTILDGIRTACIHKNPHIVEYFIVELGFDATNLEPIYKYNDSVVRFFDDSFDTKPAFQE